MLSVKLIGKRKQKRINKGYIVNDSLLLICETKEFKCIMLERVKVLRVKREIVLIRYLRSSFFHLDNGRTQFSEQ